MSAISPYYTTASLVFPSIISLIVDQGIAAGNTEKIVQFSLLLLSIGLVMSIFAYLQQVEFYKFTQMIILNLKERIMQKILQTDRIIIIIISAIFALTQQTVGKKVENGMMCLRSAVGKLASYTNEIIAHITSIKMTGLDNHVKKEYEQKNDERGCGHFLGLAKPPILGFVGTPLGSYFQVIF